MELAVSELRQHRSENARWCWNHRRLNGCKKLSLSFDELYNLFESDCNSFQDIATQSNPPVTRERIRQVYSEFFAGIFGKRNGRDRRKLCTIKRHKVEDKSVPSDPIVKRVVEEAQQHGIAFERVRAVSATNTYICSHRLRLNGHLVALRITRSPFRVLDSVTYAHFRGHSNTECEFNIMVVDIDGYPTRFFIVPTPELYNQESVYVRLDEKYKYKSHAYNGGWLAQFEDAWHLLK